MGCWFWTAWNKGSHVFISGKHFMPIVSSSIVRQFHQNQWFVFGFVCSTVSNITIFAIIWICCRCTCFG
jgi:hypothetical protein